MLWNVGQSDMYVDAMVEFMDSYVIAHCTVPRIIMCRCSVPRFGCVRTESIPTIVLGNKVDFNILGTFLTTLCRQTMVKARKEKVYGGLQFIFFS